MITKHGQKLQTKTLTKPSTKNGYADVAEAKAEEIDLERLEKAVTEYGATHEKILQG
jgi:hypothetical protein